jgi:N-ethylmaleimide reductase
MPTINLFTPGRIDGFEMRNRILMAPMTRNRAPGSIPSELAVVYYTQRASAGLIITEGTAPSPAGLGYARTPTILPPNTSPPGSRSLIRSTHTAARCSCS